MKNKLSIIIILLFTSFFTFSQDFSSKSVAELEKLKTEAVKTEDYKLAGQLNDEIKRRANEISNIDRIALAKKEMKAAAAKEDYQKAAELKKEITTREKLEEAIKNEDYAEAASLKKQLNGGVVEERAAPSSNNSNSTKKLAVVDPNFNEAEYNKTVNLKGHTPPKPGKAVVYMLRVSALGYAVAFKYFDGEKFLGQSKGVSYIRVELDPGKHTLWAAGENQSFITLDAEAGRTYFVYVDVMMGAFSAQVKLTAVRPSEGDRIQRGIELLNGHNPSTVSAAQETKIVAKLNKRGFVQDKMNAYETKWKATKNFQHLSKNEFIPESKL